ncbi:hypothetical protein GA0070213_103108 [Micromonospora humi]|uniref:Uncharacterized protein n=2 Tax=Micromonospora humi TaxID=745366 RepID=A0A1C5HH16_9ACTN|nr:hypothetical protein GA0070213_103108 [Micromonospora humi]
MAAPVYPAGMVRVGGALVGVGALVAAGSAAGLAREIARTPEWGAGWVFGLGVGVMLVLGGVDEIRHRRRFGAGYREAAGGAGVLPHTPGPETGGGEMPDYGSGHGGGGGGDCGGGSGS